MMIFSKYIIVLINICCIISFLSTHAMNNQAQDVHIHIDFGADVQDQNVPLDSAGTTSGKIMGTAVFAAGTGAAMAAALPLVKESEALTSLYVVIAGVLIYSQRQTIKEVFGPKYTNFATWVSTVSMIAFGLGSMALIDRKMSAGQK